MKARLLVAIALALLLVLAFAVVAQAVPQSVIDAIIEDARDGTINGSWTLEQIQAALAYVQNNPLSVQYKPQVIGVLEAYLASLGAPGEQGGQLAFTGGEVLLILAAGAGLIGGGAVLRRRRA